jgi:hypothetical protein
MQVISSWINRLWSSAPEVKEAVNNERTMKEYCQNIANRADLLESLKQVRVYSCSQENIRVRIEELITLGLTKSLADILNQSIETDTSDDILFEVTFILINLAYGSKKHTEEVVNSGAVPHFIRLLQHKNEKIQENAIWALGNVAADNEVFGKLILDSGALFCLLPLCNTDKLETKTLEIASWTLRRIISWPNLITSSNTWGEIYTTLMRLLFVENNEIVLNSLKALGNAPLTHQSKLIKYMINYGVLYRLIKLLDHSESKVAFHSLTLLGMFPSEENNKFSDIVLNMNVLEIFQRLLYTYATDERMVVRIYWIVSNIVAGTSEQNQRVVESGIVGRIAPSVNHDIEVIRHEALHVVSNFLYHGNRNQVQYLLRQNLIPLLFAALNRKEEERSERNIDLTCQLLDQILDLQPNSKLDIQLCNGVDTLILLEADFPSVEEFLNTYYTFITGKIREVQQTNNNTSMQDENDDDVEMSE